MISTRNRVRHREVKELSGDGEQYKKVTEFKYLNTLFNGDYIINPKINSRMVADNKYEGDDLISLLIKKLKTETYKVMLELAILHGGEADLLSKKRRQ